MSAPRGGATKGRRRASHSMDAVLTEAVATAVNEVTGHRPAFSTTGGTSDGRFIAPTGAQVLELGAINASIHQVNEHVGIEELEQLSTIYRRILEKLLS